MPGVTPWAWWKSRTSVMSRIASLRSLQQFEQCHRRGPAADRHRLVLRCADDLAKSAPRPLSAETLRVDHAVTRPDGVDSRTRVEDAHRRVGVDPHEKDRIAVIDIRLLAKAVGLVPDDGLNLLAGQREDRDELAVEPKGLRQGFFDLPLHLIRW